MNKSLIFKIVNILLYILFIVGMLFLIGFEILVRKEMHEYFSFDPSANRVYVYIIGLLLLYMDMQLINIFKTIKADTPFVYANVISLKKIAVAGVLIGLAFILSLTTSVSLLRIIGSLAFICAGLCGYVFSQLFKSAIYIKEENDYTI